MAHTARELDRPKSTITREIARNSGLYGYDPVIAQHLSDNRRRSAYKANKRTPELITWVDDRLKEKWSPEQFVGSVSAAGYALAIFSEGAETLLTIMKAPKLVANYLQRQFLNMVRLEIVDPNKDRPSLLQRSETLYAPWAA